jgi:hypothetical protein
MVKEATDDGVGIIVCERGSIDRGRLDCLDWWIMHVVAKENSTTTVTNCN